MAFVTVEDTHGSFEMTVFPNLYASTSHLLTTDAAILVDGQIQKDEKNINLLCNQIVPIQKAEETWTVSIHLRLDMTNTKREQLERLNSVLKNHLGTCKAYLHIPGPDMMEAVIALPETLQLQPRASLRKEVNACLGYPAYESVCGHAGNPNDNNNIQNRWKQKR